MSILEAKDGLRFRLRPFVEQDRNWILATWLRENAPDTRIPREVYFRAQESKIKAWLEKPTREIVVACDADANSDWHGYGWAAAERIDGKRALHFVFVKGPFRRQGIGRAMLAELGGVGGIAIHTHAGRGLRHLHLRSIFDPYQFKAEP